MANNSNIDDLRLVWAEALPQLEKSIGFPAVDSWLRSTELAELKVEQATLVAPSNLHAERIRKQFIDPVRKVLGVASLMVRVKEGHEPTRLPAEIAPARKHKKAAPTEVAPAPFRDGNAPVLNSDYHFDHFVVGPCNRFAHAACLGVADRPGTAFNPLFLHGSVGLGKTHLMQAVCHRLFDDDQNLSILYLSCEQFINHFIGSLQQGDFDGFRNRYRRADVLIIDDIQMLANKDRTQEEFFHTFNALHNARKQIVLSSDAPPEDIPSLQERLVSRFKWGLVAEIEPPCFETRVAILNSKADYMGLVLPDPVLKLIAEHIENNVRELEGTLTKIQAMAALTNRTIDLGLAREVMGATLRRANRPVRIDDIIDVTTERFGVKLNELQSKTRRHSVVFPRQISMFLARQLTTLSYAEIGGFFGGRDHSTVVYSFEQIEARRRVDADFAMTVAELIRAVRQQAGSHD